MKDYAELKALIEKRGVHPVFGDVGEGWNLEQNSYELATFLVRMQELGVQSVLEIGTGYKGGLSRFLAADMGWTVTSVDVKPYHHVFEGVHYITIPPGGKNYPHFDNMFDLVFIDGDHSYEQVKSDYTVWGFYAGKVIAFHDICGYRDCDGVRQFWDETAKVETYMGGASHTTLKQRFHTAIFFESPQRAGIGWIEL